MRYLKKYESLLLFLLIALVILIRVKVESTHYCTPDSNYYLEVSRNILSGEGCVGPKVFDYNSETHQLIPLYSETAFGHPDQYRKEFFAVWPLGYPAGIVMVSKLTTLDPLWASKIVNLLLLALDFYFLYLLFAGTNSFSLYYFGSFTMLEICSYTWSENLFLPFFLLMMVCIKKIITTEQYSVQYILLLTLALAGMCMARYASVIFFAVIAGLIFFYYRKKDSIRSYSFLLALTFGSLLIGLYLFNNYLQSGYLTGMPRTNTQDFTVGELISRFFLGMFNQLHIIKQFRYDGSAELLVYLFEVLIQLVLTGYLLLLLRKNILTQPFNWMNKFLVYTGLLYLIFLVYMTFTSTIDPFDYRTLLPFSFPVFIALLSEIEVRLHQSWQTKGIIAVKIFFIFSLLMNVPKKFLLNLILSS